MKKGAFHCRSINSGHYINSTVGKKFFYDIISLYNPIAYSILIAFQNSASNCMFGVGDGGAGVVCRVCSGLAVTYMYVYMCIVGFERAWHIFLVFLLLTLGK